MRDNNPAPVYWLGLVPDKDDFGDTITTEFIDGRINRVAAWGLLTPRSWLHYGCGRLGPGYGQRYIKQQGGKFLKVEG